MSRRSPLSPVLVAVAAIAPALAAGADAPPLPHRVFGASRAAIDEILARPYDADVPFGSTGDRLWASSPQGWAFGDDVHWVSLSHLGPLDLEVADDLGPLDPAKATSHPSHVLLEGTKRSLRASASSTFATDNVRNPLARPFRPGKRWTCWSSGRREDWYAVDFGATRTIDGLALWFFDDAPSGGCRPPDSYEVQVRDGSAWRALPGVRSVPERPAKGENTASFAPIATREVRVVVRNAGEAYYTGLYGFEPRPTPAGPAADASPLRVRGVKFITADDVLVAEVRVTNPTAKPASIVVRPICDRGGGKAVASIGGTVRRDGEGHGPVQVLSGSWPAKHHGFDVRHALRYEVVDGRAGGRANDVKRVAVAIPADPDDYRHAIAPGETKVFRAALSIRLEGEPTGLDAIIRDPERPAPKDAPPDADRDLAAEQARRYQGWFDANLAYFDCPDPWVRKMFYHRAYNLRKNMLDPRLGRLRWPTQSEGRWRSDWYANVISYGAGHQVREARWLRDPKYWQGHVRTWAENERPDGVFPNFIKPNEIGHEQYTDWVGSTAWDGYLVHPDRAFLADVADKLAANVRGWQKAYDPDGDGLLFVDSHWWTGMEWQPSFFADSGYRTDPRDVTQPVRRVDLDRVDLTAYNYGNAANVARIYRALGRDAEAGEFEALAARIAAAVSATMWDPSSRFFYSARRRDKTRVDVKEVIGVYPFYFGMLPAGKGYEAAWASIVDPEEFWTPWPVASASKKCPAYAQDGWHFPSSRGTVCMWNGPTWPHANSIVLSGMARTLRANRGGGAIALTSRHLWDLFLSFTKAQYRGQDLADPWTGEFYDGETAAWKTAERDYNHSTWIDVLAADLIGIIPRADDVFEVDPLIPDGALASFVLDGQAYHGHDVTVVWDAPGGADLHGDGRSGLDVYLDGRLVASSPTLARLRVVMATGRALAGGD